MPGDRRPRAVPANDPLPSNDVLSSAGRPSARDTATGADDRVARVPAGATAAVRGHAPVRGYSAWRDPVTWTVAALVFGAYFALSLFRLLRLSPTSWDLGIYTEYVKQLSLLRAPTVDVRGPGFNLLGDHFQVAVAVLAPFFRLVPSAGTLLFFQALATAVSVFPVVTVAHAFAGRSAGRLIGFAYGFCWGLQQMIDFDFHEIAIAVPLYAFSVSALVRRKPAAAVAWAVPLVFVKEDQGFTVAAIGLYLAASAALTDRGGRRNWRNWRPLAAGDGRWGNGRAALWGGVFLVGWGLFWSVFAISVIIPHFAAGHGYYYWKDGGVLGGAQPFSLGGLVSQTALGWPTKLQTVALLLLPTAFAAVGSPVALLTLPSLALRFLSTNSAYWGTEWHYNATVMPILFIAAAEALARWRAVPAAGSFTGATGGHAGWAEPGWAVPAGGSGGRARAARRSVAVAWNAARGGIGRHGPAMMAAVTVALAFQFPLNDLWHSSTYQFDPHVAAAGAAMAVVPDGATVQTTLDLLAPLAARTDTFWIGNSGNPLTRYIVFDGADSGYNPAPANVPEFIRQLYPAGGYVQVFRRDGVYVFRR